METKANYVAVGIFTLLAILAAFGFVYWTAGIGEGGDTATLRVRIPGSASGLGRGSAVLFNGVKIGDVSRVYIDVDNPGMAVADTKVDRLSPITKSTEADIGLAGLTGQANIELKGVAVNEPNLIAEAEKNGTIAEIIADPSAFTNLLQSAQDIFKRADAVLEELEGFAKESRGPLTATVNNVQAFSDALGRNAAGIDKFLGNFATLSDTLANVSGQLNSTLKSAEDILNAVDRQKIANIVANFEKFTTALDTATSNLDTIMGGVATAVTSVNKFASDADATLGKVDALLDGAEPGAIGRVIANIENVTGSAQTVVADISKVTGKLGERSGDIDQIIADTRLLSGRLAQASVRVDGIMENVDKTMTNVSALSQTASGTIGRVDKIIEGVNPDSVRTSIDNIAEASQSAKMAVADVTKLTSKFGERANDVDQIITDARLLSGRLAQASVRIDGVLVKVDALLGSGEAEGLAANASETLKSFKQVADTLNSRLGTITDGLARFSGAGLRDVEALVRDSRRSISRIEQAVTDFERNPQRIITGGSGEVRQYDGRTRR